MLLEPAFADTTRRRVKVSEISLVFWTIQIMASTNGESGGDYLVVNAGWGAEVTSVVMAGGFAAVLLLQVRTRHFTPWLYWLTVVLASVVATQGVELLTDRMEVSLFVSTLTFAGALLAILASWYGAERTLALDDIVNARRELHYWAAVLCAFALGTSAGELATEVLQLGFGWECVLFAALLGVSYAIWRFGGYAVPMFWIACVLTRPLGAALGDLVSQPTTNGGLGFGAAWTSTLFLSVIVILVGMEQLRQETRDFERPNDDSENQESS